MRTIGIDPGKTGAVALLHGPSLIALVDMPFTIDTKNRPRIDMVHLEASIVDLVDPNPDNDVTFIVEEPSFMPGQRGQATASRWLGQVEGVIARWEPSPIKAYPHVWKRHHGLIKRPKDDSRLLALELWPEARSLLCRKKDVDRAEAALIARWHWDTQRGDRRCR